MFWAALWIARLALFKSSCDRRSFIPDGIIAFGIIRFAHDPTPDVEASGNAVTRADVECRDLWVSSKVAPVDSRIASLPVSICQRRTITSTYFGSISKA